MRTEGNSLPSFLSPPSALAVFEFMLVPNPNPGLYSSLPISPMPCPSPSPPLHFPPTTCLFLLCLFPLGLRRAKKGALGEVAVGAQPPKLGISLFVSLSLGLRSQTSQVLWKLITYSSQRSQIKTDQFSFLLGLSPFFKALFYIYIDPRATELILATLLKGILQALGHSLET